MTQLFSSAPDLLEDFKQFLPESAAQAKAQAAAAKQATEDAAMLSNVRSHANFEPMSHHTQAQTPRPEIKMPPVGNFAPPSVGKESKKRRGGAGSHVTIGAAAMDSGTIPSGSNNRIRNPGGAVNKVCLFLCCSQARQYPYPSHCAPSSSTKEGSSLCQLAFGLYFSKNCLSFSLLMLMRSHYRNRRLNKPNQQYPKSLPFLPT